jgi:alpha-tubulin suppressor-like RCC1 family protein
MVTALARRESALTLPFPTHGREKPFLLCINPGGDSQLHLHPGNSHVTFMELNLIRSARSSTNIMFGLKRVGKSVIARELHFRELKFGSFCDFEIPFTLDNSSKSVINILKTPMQRCYRFRILVRPLGFLLTAVLFGFGSEGRSLAHQVLGWGSMTLPYVEPGEHYIKAGGGWWHGLAITTKGGVVAWGRGDYGQCAIPAFTNAIDICGGEAHSAVLTADGRVHVYGPLYHSNSNAPPSATNVIQIASGGSHLLALRADGKIVAWGYSDVGQTNIPPGLNSVAAIGAGADFNIAVRSNGTLVAWGDNYDGQCNVPPGLTNVVRVACGHSHVVALKSDGTVTCWGWNYEGQTNTPAGLSNVVAVAASSYHSMALKADGTIIGWGDNYYGEATAPPELTTNVTAIAAAGEFLSIAIKKNGELFVWGGYNQHGESITPGSLRDVIEIAAAGDVVALRKNGTVLEWGWSSLAVPAGLTNVTAVGAGGYHSLAVKGDHTVVCWGANDYGQCTPPTNLSNVIAVAGGYQHSAALKADGTVVAWGRDHHGQTEVPNGLSGVTKIASGDYHIIALKADRTLVGWGMNDYGQASPPEYATNIVDIAAGVYHTLALTADGTVLAWGAGGPGTTNTYTDRDQCKVPLGLTHVIGIGAGEYHSLALQADGTVVGWGGDWNASAVSATAQRMVAVRGGGDFSVALASAQEISAITPTLQGPLISFQTFLGRNYAVQYKSSVGASNWSEAPSSPGTGFLSTFTDTNWNSAMRFYRLRESR